nr:unnamed protein product [Spirometra erinaceieuropaei]
MAAEQQRVGCPGDESVSGLQLNDVPLTAGSGTILSDASTPFHRPPLAFIQWFHPRPYLCRSIYGWAEAIPLTNTQAETIVKAFDSRWVANFGAPSTVTTDRGAQFESAFFQTLLNFLGCTRIRTTAYQPAANGRGDPFHRQLDTALRAVDDTGNWSDNLPLAFLGIRAALKSDLGYSAAELGFGTTLRLLGEMITPTPRRADETPDNLVHRLRQFMRSLSSVPPGAPMIESYAEKDLDKCTHAFVLCDPVRQPPESPYEGPFCVLARNAKICRILRGDKEDVNPLPEIGLISAIID